VIADPVDGPDEDEIRNGNAADLPWCHFGYEVSESNPFSHFKKGHGQAEFLLLELDRVIEIPRVEKLLDDGFGGSDIHFSIAKNIIFIEQIMQAIYDLTLKNLAQQAIQTGLVGQFGKLEFEPFSCPTQIETVATFLLDNS
jgi:hypothetical protein